MTEILKEPDFIIHPKIRDYFSITSEFDDEVLERSIIETKGPEHPLVVWDEKNVLLDGHRRYKVCKAYSLPYRIDRKSFKTLDDVHIWMLGVQLARRNPLDHDKAILISRYTELIRRKKGQAGELAELVAKAAGVSVRSAYRANQYVKMIETMPQEWQDALANRSFDISRAYLRQVAELDHTEQLEILELCLATGDSTPLEQRFPPSEAVTREEQITGGAAKTKSSQYRKTYSDDQINTTPIPLEEQVIDPSKGVAAVSTTTPNMIPEFQEKPAPRETGSEEEEEGLLSGEVEYQQPATPIVAMTIDKVQGMKAWKKCNRLAINFANATDILFSEEGLGIGSQHSVWKHRMDRMHHAVAQLLKEIEDNL